MWWLERKRELVDSTDSYTFPKENFYQSGDLICRRDSARHRPRGAGLAESFCSAAAPGGVDQFDTFAGIDMINL
jgi:hypothetical protein